MIGRVIGHARGSHGSAHYVRYTFDVSPDSVELDTFHRLPLLSVYQTASTIRMRQNLVDRVLIAQLDRCQNAPRIPHPIRGICRHFQATPSISWDVCGLRFCMDGLRTSKPVSCLSIHGLSQVNADNPWNSHLTLCQPTEDFKRTCCGLPTVSRTMFSGVARAHLEQFVGSSQRLPRMDTSWASSLRC